MEKRYIFLNFILIILVAALNIYLQSHKNVKAENLIKSETPRNVFTGAWVGGFWDSNTKILNTINLKDFEKTIGNHVAIANIFTDWTYLAEPALLKNLDEINANDWTPMISSNPLFFEGCRKGDFSIYKTIANGDCDVFLNKIADNLHQYGKPVFLRFAWEMNLPDMWWSVEKTKSTPEEFIAAWQKIYTILNQNTQNNIIMVLSFNTSSDTTTPYSKLYPGDDYVDWVAIDGYNWGTSASWSRWTSFNGVLTNSYQELTSITDKPIMISEVGTSPDGGNKAAWYDDMLNIQIPYHYYNVRAVVFFNEDKSVNEGIDWRIENSKESIFVVKSALKNKLYSPKLN